MAAFEMKVEKFGESLIALFPEELVAQLKIREGDRLRLVEPGNRDYLLSLGPHFPEKKKAIRPPNRGLT